jgi:uncharacterized repeat protein (TIGR01451 family)
MDSGASTEITLVAQIGEGVSGELINSVTATGTPPYGDNVQDTATATVTVTPVGPQALIEVVKSGPETAAPGDTITYTYTVTNEGDCALSDVAVTDSLGITVSYVSGDENDDGLLDTDETWIFTATYVVPTDGSSIPPQGTVTFSVSRPGEHSFYTTTINGQTYESWCLDRDHHMFLGKPYTAIVYSSLDPDLPDGVVDKPENLDLVNYILNQDYSGLGAGWQEIQAAIWTLIDNEGPMGSFDQDIVDDIVDDAKTNGGGFVPGPDQITLYILYSGEGLASAQVIGIEVTPQIIVNTATATGMDPFGNEVTAEDSWSVVVNPAGGAGNNGGDYTFYTPPVACLVRDVLGSLLGRLPLWI